MSSEELQRQLISLRDFEPQRASDYLKNTRIYVAIRAPDDHRQADDPSHLPFVRVQRLDEGALLGRQALLQVVRQRLDLTGNRSTSRGRAPSRQLPREQPKTRLRRKVLRLYEQHVPLLCFRLPLVTLLHSYTTSANEPERNP